MYLLCFLLYFLQISHNVNGEQNGKLVINENTYSNIFLRKREEQQSLLRHLQSTQQNYEKKYKLLEIGIDKVLSVLKEKRNMLDAKSYIPLNGFPKTETEIEALALILENVCLFGDLVLHMPEMSYKILAKHKSWKEQINVELYFIQHFYKTIIDGKTQRMLSLLNQEINPEERSDNFINPYHASESNTEQPIKPKKKKKIRKGPQLGSANVEL